jgi:hypothetical protein
MHDVDFCAGCAYEMGVGVGFVGQDVQEGTIQGGAEGLGARTNARGISGQDVAQNAGKAIEKTADAAGQIAKTVKVVAIIGAVGAAAWVGYALWKARQQAVGIQAGAQQAIFAHPELLRL